MALVKIQVRRDTAANWTASNPVLAVGEPGLETDTGKVKYGDGVRNWSTLPYSSGVALGSSAPPAAGTAAAGTSETAARSDHSHALPSNLTASTVTTTGNALVGGSLTVSGPLVGGSHKHTTGDIQDFSSTVFAQLAAALKAGSNITAAVDSARQTITLSAAGAEAAPLAITSDPVDAVSSDGTARFQARASGGSGAIAYQWEQSLDKGATWTPISNATGTSLALTSLVASDDGNQYRMRATAGDQSVTTLSAVLRTQQVAITAQPPDVTATVGTMVSLAVAANAGSATVSYQWQRRGAASDQWVDVVGATNPVYAFTASAPSDADGDQYRAVAVALGASVFSRAATVVVRGPSLSIFRNPSDIQDVSGSASFTVEATSGTPPYTYQWQRLNGGSGTWALTDAFADIPAGTAGASGVTSQTLALTGQSAAQHLRKYRVVVTDSVGDTITSTSATLTTLSLRIVTHPSRVNAVSGTTLPANAFVALGTADGGVTYQWQKSTDAGSTWVNISGATGANYGNFTPALSDNSSLYRAVINGDGQSLSTDAALLSVTPNTATFGITAQPDSFYTFNPLYDLGSAIVVRPSVTLSYANAPSAPAGLNRVVRATLEVLDGGNWVSIQLPWVSLEVASAASGTVRADGRVALNSAASGWRGLVNAYSSFQLGNSPPPRARCRARVDVGFALTAGDPKISPVATAFSSEFEFEVSNPGVGFLVTGRKPAVTRSQVTEEVPVGQSVVLSLVSAGGALGLSAGNCTPRVTWWRLRSGSYTDVTAQVSNNTLTLASASNEINGDSYVVVHVCGLASGAPSPQPSYSTTVDTEIQPKTNVVQIAVIVPPLTITTQPSDTTSALGVANFTFAYTGGNGTTPQVSWERLLPTGTWTPIAGAVATTLSLSGLTSALNGAQYRAVVRIGTQTATTRAATLSVPGATITLNPVDRVAASDGTATFVFDFTTDCASPVIVWERKKAADTLWVPIPSADTKTLRLTGLAPEAGSINVRASVRCGGVTTYSSVATVAVPSFALFVSHPASQNVEPGQSVTLSFTTSLTPGTYSFSWQYRRSGSASWIPWNARSALSSGQTISFTAKFLEHNGTEYRVALRPFSMLGEVYSQSALVQVGQSGVSTIVDPAAEVQIVAVAYAKGAFVALSDYQTQIARRSTDNGATWRNVFLTDSTQWDGIISTNSGRLIAYSAGTKSYTRTTGVATLAKSDDGGLTWSSLPTPSVFQHELRMFYLPEQNAILAFYRTLVPTYGGFGGFAGYIDSNAITMAVSLNDGVTWSAGYSLPPGPAVARYHISSVASSPSGKVVACTHRPNALSDLLLYRDVAASGWGPLLPADDLSIFASYALYPRPASGLPRRR